MHKDSSPKLSLQGFIVVIAVLTLARFTGKKAAYMGRSRMDLLEIANPGREQALDAEPEELIKL